MDECVVNGALATLLRVMRVVGMMPVEMVPLSGAFVVRYSNAKDVIARRFFGCFCVLLATCDITYVVLQFLNPSYKRMQKIVMFLSTGVGISIRVVVIFVAVLKGRQRTKQLCKYLNDIQKSDVEDTNNVAVANVEKRRFKLFVMFVALTPILNLIEIITISTSTRKTESNCLLILRRFFNQFSFITIATLEGQFVFTVLSVHTALQAINRRLGKLLTNFKKNQERSNEISSAHKTIRKLATSYDTLCDVMRTLDKDNGLLVFILSTLMFLYVLQYSFFLVVYWNINPYTERPFSDIDLDKMNFNRIMQCIRLAHILLKILLIIEPCQWTYNEMEVTRLFLTRLTHYAPAASGPLVNELEMFYRLAFTNIPSYSPLQLFTLKRTFVLEIFGAVTAWMLIILRQKSPQGEISK